MKKPNFSHEHKKIVPSELKVTASEVANEEAQADLDGDSEEWDDDSYKLDEDGEQFEISE
jgi:hypothetical protein